LKHKQNPSGLRHEPDGMMQLTRPCRQLPRFAGGSEFSRQQGAIAQVMGAASAERNAAGRKKPPRPEWICVLTDDTLIDEDINAASFPRQIPK